MTEQEALLTAKENVEAAMSALDFPQGSHAADEAYDALDQALQRLEAGLMYCESEDGATEHNEAVGPPEDPQGEGEGSPSLPADTSPLYGEGYGW